MRELGIEEKRMLTLMRTYKKDLVAYRDMLSTVVARVQDGITKQLTIAQTRNDSLCRIYTWPGMDILMWR